jgi:hypothetical protein
VCRDKNSDLNNRLIISILLEFWIFVAIKKVFVWTTFPLIQGTFSMVNRAGLYIIDLYNYLVSFEGLESACCCDMEHVQFFAPVQK